MMPQDLRSRWCGLRVSWCCAGSGSAWHSSSNCTPSSSNMFALRVFQRSQRGAALLSHQPPQPQRTPVRLPDPGQLLWWVLAPPEP